MCSLIIKASNNCTFQTLKHSVFFMLSPHTGTLGLWLAHGHVNNMCKSRYSLGIHHSLLTNDWREYHVETFYWCLFMIIDGNISVISTCYSSKHFINLCSIVMRCLATNPEVHVGGGGPENRILYTFCVQMYTSYGWCYPIILHQEPKHTLKAPGTGPLAS